MTATGKQHGAHSAIRSAARTPFGQAALGVASLMLAGNAAQAQSTPITEIGATSAGAGGSGGDTGYLPSSNANSARLQGIPLLSTPQTVNVVTQEVMREQVSSSVRDALRNVSGVTFRAGEGGNQGDTPYIRGFSAQGDIFRDAVRDPGWYTRDTFAIDAVEVYKGPSSILFGRGSTGGAINLISKTPLDRAFLDTTVTANTGPGWRTTVDVNGKANENVWGRLVVMGQGYDTPGRDNVEENRIGVNPSIKFRLTDQTFWTLAYIYQRDRNTPDYGIPYLRINDGYPRRVAPVSRNNWYGILSQGLPDLQNDNVHIATSKIEHRFAENLKLTNTTRYVYVDHFQRNVFPEPNANVPLLANLNSNWTPNRAQVLTQNEMIANQTDLNAKFMTGTWEHTVAAGLDIQQENRDFTRNNFSGQGATNFLNPNPWRAPGLPLAPTATQYTSGEATTLGAFVADQVKLNQWWEVLGSARYERYQFDQNNPLVPQTFNATNNMLSWRVGLVFHPTPNTSLYAMHGTSFNPSAENLTIAANNFRLEPEKNVTTEFGAKAELMNGQLQLATAVFKTTKTNMRVTNPVDSTQQILAAEIEAPGIEASIVGKITQQWQMIASYTYVHARVSSSPFIAQIGAVPLNSADNSFSLWTTYDITAQWQIGGGAFYVGDWWGDFVTPASANAPAIINSALVPAYWRFDAMAAYKITPKSTIQFNIYNITNEFYAATAYSNWFVPGPSRYAAVTYRHSF
ncbi:MAG TPA: TonB-dependent siderophore receptor [Xanthobacteraceae bacterium]|nr:TonB-dependent siderophore receptor [Xanthobacteraceae bacterium]